MTTTLTVLALLVAAAAAIRSTWSPCGLSMLSTITPFSERGRGHRYAATCAWFIVGATVGGLALGALSAGLAALVAGHRRLDGGGGSGGTGRHAGGGGVRHRCRPGQAAGPRPPGQRAVARRLSPLGLRRRLRLPDRLRAGHLHHHCRGLPARGAGRPDGESDGGPGRRRRLRPHPGVGRDAHPAPADTGVTPRLPSAVRRAAALGRPGRVGVPWPSLPWSSPRGSGRFRWWSSFWPWSPGPWPSAWWLSRGRRRPTTPRRSRRPRARRPRPRRRRQWQKPRRRRAAGTGSGRLSRQRR